MLESEIYKSLESIFEDSLGEAVELKPETTAADVEDWDSLNHVQIMMQVERAFKIRMASSEMANLKNVGELVEMIQRKTNT